MPEEPRPEEPREETPDREGAAFAVVMALAAYLGRDNPDFVYPQIFWAFLGLLVFGLLRFSLLSKRLEPSRWRALHAWGSALLVSVIVFYSGGSESNFWVMYLLPIFSAALSCGRRDLVIVTAAVGAVLAAFYAPSLRALAWAEILGLAVKAATLAAAASATERAARGERRARGLLEDERAGAAREQLALRERLQHMDRLSTMGTLTASITHELNKPIAVILGYTELVGSGMTDIAKMNFCVERIRTSALHCRQVIDDMLSYSRGQKSEKKPADVNEAVRKCVKLRRYEWVSTGIQLEEAYAPALPQVSLSASGFQQVVFNLFNNAVHSIRSKPDPQGRIQVRTEARGGTVLIALEDDGPGIPPEVMARIWEPFFTTKPAGEGTGLGLSICRRIIEEHRGKLSVDSEPGRRTVFTIELPAAGASPREIKTA